jgi:MFS family permease
MTVRGMFAGRAAQRRDVRGTEGAPAYRRYVLGILTVVCTLNYLDRCLMILLLQPIKADLKLSDTQLGFLTGIAFGLFYATLGLPIARWSDRANRATITSAAIGLWGATVMLCLFVGNFVQLVLARVAAAIGESGCMPPTYSLLGDYFPRPAERTRAMALYMMAGPLAALVSFMLGGWLNKYYGWRTTFFLMGIPGLIVAALVKATVAEPRLLNMRDPLRTEIKGPRMTDVLKILWYRQASRHLALGVVMLYTMGLGLAPWYAAFLMRSHGMDTSELGVWLGLIFGLGGLAGIGLGGYVAGRWFAQDERGQMRLTAIMVSLTVPCLILFLLFGNRYLSLVALMPLVLVCNFFYGPTFALLQRLVPDNMRATTLAVVMLLANLIGMGAGPAAVGAMSDFLTPMLREDALRYAMLTMSLVALGAAYHFLKAGHVISDDLAAAQARLAVPQDTNPEVAHSTSAN